MEKEIRAFERIEYYARDVLAYLHEHCDTPHSGGCIACQKCANACPSTVMGAILKRDKKTIPDCFACYTCRDVCPTESIRFSTGKRDLPPVGHFDRKKPLRPDQS